MPEVGTKPVRPAPRRTSFDRRHTNSAKITQTNALHIASMRRNETWGVGVGGIRLRAAGSRKVDIQDCRYPPGYVVSLTCPQLRLRVSRASQRQWLHCYCTLSIPSSLFPLFPRGALCSSLTEMAILSVQPIKWLQGDPRWAAASPLASYAPIVVLTLLVLCIIQIVLGAIWVASLQGSLQLCVDIKTLRGFTDIVFTAP